MPQNNPWKQQADSVNDDILDLWEETAIPETPSGVIPTGKYPARLVSGELDKARTGSVCFRISWELEGEYAGRRLVSRHYLTPKAIGRTKSELVPLGIHGDHLRGACALPQARATLSVVQRADEVGDLYNEVRRVAAIVEQGQASAPTTSQDAAQAANGDVSTSPAVPTTEASCAPAETTDDSFLDEEF